MLGDNTIGYYRSREVRERALAAGANNPAIARIHHELAEHYRERVEQVSLASRARR